MALLFLAIYFIACEILVQKDIMPRFLKKLHAGKLIFISLSVILTLAVISFYVKYAVVLVILSTIYFSVVISNYYLKEFQKMERGKKI